MDTIIQTYLSEKLNDTDKRTSEFEVRFTNNGNRLTKIDYDNVMQHLINLGFKSLELNGNHLLRVGVEYDHKINKLRVELNELTDIKYLCRTNELPSRMNVIHKNKLQTYKNEDYMFSIGLAEENKVNDAIVDYVKDGWNKSKKTFRFMNRIRLYHPDISNMFIDCSIIRSSKYVNGKMNTSITIDQSDVFNNAEQYEIEVEIDNKITDLSEIKKLISKGVKYIIGGLQNTIYPISYTEMNKIGNEYLKLIKSKDQKISKRNFIGQMPDTLQRNHVKHFLENNYTVTEKADGIRKLLFINDKGKMFYITRSGQIEYTGKQLTTQETKYIYNTIIDGEHVLFSSNKEYINLYACFDIYFMNNKDQRNNPFLNDTETCRLNVLKSNMEILSKYFTIEVKDFVAVSSIMNIYDACNIVLNRKYVYDTDGLIFTPMNGGGIVSKMTKMNPNPITWENCFKWKPPEHNSIDFLVITKRDDKGQENIEYKYIEGIKDNDVIQYKTLYLHVGIKGSINPCQNVYNDSYIENDKYNRVKFYPSNPSDEYTHICNVPLKLSKDGTMQMYTEENEIFTTDMIVEFRYVIDAEKYWSWKPMRVRWDKTYEYKNEYSGHRNYGNDYKVADSVWKSIHYPITEDMLRSGEVIDSESIDEIYYVEQLMSKKSYSLSNFHNLIKHELITNTLSKDGILIDFACGKAGDLNKWEDAGASFVLGIDVSRDCIENLFDGACKRYLNRKNDKVNPYQLKCLFIRGDSSKHIRSGKAFSSDKEFDIVKSVFGDEKPRDGIGKGVIQQYNVAKNGFDVASVQFAIHYFFKDSEHLYTFLQNVNESVKEGGYFVGTCYDGDTVFQLLKDKQRNDGIIYGTLDNKLCEIIKYYDEDEFLPDERSLGYEIGVYNKSIGVVIKEYLVNFAFLIDIMQQYGFELVNNQSRQILSTATGMFQDVYKKIEHMNKSKIISKRLIGESLNMTEDEKNMSFLNRYFIFKKMRHVDTKVTSKTKEPKYNIKKMKKKIVIKTT